MEPLGVAAGALASRSADRFAIAVTSSRLYSPMKLIVYPGAYHVFDAPGPGRRYFGHWLEYNAAADEAAKEEVRRFLAEHLAR